MGAHHEDRPLPVTSPAVINSADALPEDQAPSGPRLVPLRHGTTFVIAEPGTIFACPRCDRCFRRPAAWKSILRLGIHCTLCGARVGRDAVVREAGAA